MDKFIATNSTEKAETLAQFQKSLDELKKVYDRLITDIRLTYEDYQQQQYADAIRMSMQAQTKSFYRDLAMAGIAGLGIGGTLGLGLSLLGLGLGRATAAKAS